MLPIHWWSKLCLMQLHPTAISCCLQIDAAPLIINHSKWKVSYSTGRFLISAEFAARKTPQKNLHFICYYLHFLRPKCIFHYPCFCFSTQRSSNDIKNNKLAQIKLLDARVPCLLQFAAKLGGVLTLFGETLNLTPASIFNASSLCLLWKRIKFLACSRHNCIPALHSALKPPRHGRDSSKTASIVLRVCSHGCCGGVCVRARTLL